MDIQGRESNAGHHIPCGSSGLTAWIKNTSAAGDDIEGIVETEYLNPVISFRLNF